MVRITIQRIDGVKSVDSNAVSNMATIVYDDTKVDYEKIKKELTQAGYPPVGKPEYLN
jgi:copper chaperone CopZ